MFEETFSYKNEKKHSLRLHLLKEDFTKAIELIFAIRELRILIDVNAFIQLKVRILSVCLIPKWICIKLYSIYN